MARVRTEGKWKFPSHGIIEDLHTRIAKPAGRSNLRQPGQAAPRRVASKSGNEPEEARVSQEQHILYEVEDRVAKITVNRPRYRNSQSTPLLFQLDEAITRAGNDRGARVIVLAG